MNNSVIDVNVFLTTIITTTTSRPLSDGMFQRLFYFKIWKYRMFIVHPIISVVGLVLNILGGIIIVKSGLKKSSNCLLLGLTFADICTLTSGFNVPLMLRWVRYKIPPPYVGWELSYTWAFVCFRLQFLILIINNIGIATSTCITVLITVERLIAVFLPLHFSRIVTPRRVWLAMLASVLLMLPQRVFQYLAYSFYYRYSSRYDAHYGSYSRTTKFYSIYQDLIKYADIPFLHMFPLAFVTTGYIAISAKIAMTMQARNKLTSAATEKSTNQTTKTLIAVCLVFSFTKIVYTISKYIGRRSDTNLIYTITSILHAINQCLLLVNSACNFIIYIGINTKFRAIFLEMMHIKRSKS